MRCVYFGYGAIRKESEKNYPYLFHFHIDIDKAMSTMTLTIRVGRGGSDGEIGIAMISFDMLLFFGARRHVKYIGRGKEILLPWGLYKIIITTD